MTRTAALAEHTREPVELTRSVHFVPMQIMHCVLVAHCVALQFGEILGVIMFSWRSAIAPIYNDYRQGIEILPDISIGICADCAPTVRHKPVQMFKLNRNIFMRGRAKKKVCSLQPIIA